MKPTHISMATLSRRNSVYRPDIDGLRAIAVAVVVLYHAGVAGVGGGYIGVDVFFVISGYLVTHLLTDSAARGLRPQLTEFYLRRGYWSIAVEEQFYLIYPLTLYLIGRHLPRHRAAALAAGSFAVCVWASYQTPGSNYFLATSCIYEAGGRVLYSDRDHLSNSGALHLSNLLAGCRRGVGSAF